MRNNKRLLVKPGRTPKQSDNIKEAYELFRSRAGYSQEDRLSPEELGKKLASDLMEKIDKEVVIK